MYQVDVTIDRWLALAADEHLALECGEDIDLIASALTADDDRLLEQVKVREGALSLRSSEALEALANATDHLASNPTAKLSFRFTTTASVAREQDHPDPAAPPGLQLWEQVRVGEPEPETSSDPIGTIQAILKSSMRPSAIPVSAWATARVVFQNRDRLSDLVRRFQWAMAETNPQDRSAQVIESLLTAGHAADRNRAVEAYERLFAFVFQRLSRRGPKVLTRAALETELARTPGADAERAMIARLRGRLDACGIQLEALEQRVERIDRSLATAFGLPSAAIALGVPALDLTPPPLARTLAPRARVVEQMCAVRAPWLAIQADAGTGKSHLAVLTLRTLGRSVVWLRLSRTTPDEGSARVVRALAAWAAVGSFDPDLVCKRAAEKLRLSDCSLVLDDLPRGSKDDATGRVLVRLSDAIANRELSVVTTSSHPLPGWLRRAAGTRCVELPCPPFKEDEAAELFVAFDGARFVREHRKSVATLTALTHGHPTLLAAMASFLSAHDWSWNLNVMEGILQGTYAKETHSDTLEALHASVPEPATRELLDRLRLHSGAFNSEVVHALARVRPEIDRPMDRLSGVVGIWVQAVDATEWRLSPLLSALPGDTLPPGLTQSCHAALALHLLRTPLDQTSGAALVSHWFAAGEPDKGGIALAMLLDALARDQRGVPPGLLLALAWDGPLPGAMSVGVRIMVRRSQLRAAGRYGRDPDFLRSDLDALLIQAQPEDDWAVVLAETGRFVDTFADAPGLAAQSFERATLAASRARLPGGGRYPVPDLTPLAWSQAPNVRTRAHLEAWLRIIEQLPVSARTWRDGSLSARSACQIVCDNLWLRESAKPDFEANWAESHEDLDRVVVAARRMVFPYLQACALRGKITLLIEREKRFEEGETLANAFLAEHGDDAECVVLIEDVLGRQYYHASAYAEALVHLRRALARGPQTETHLLCLTANYASRASVFVEPAAAIPFARDALRLARGSHVPAEAELNALGELAIAHWYEGEPEACGQVLLEAGRSFQRNSADDLFVAHVGVTFLQAVTCLSRVLIEQPGSRHASPTALPPRGFFQEQPWKASVQWREESPTVLAFLLTQVAERLGMEDDARFWAERTLAKGLFSAEHGLSANLQFALLPYLLLSGRPEAPIAVADHFVSLLGALEAGPAGANAVPAPTPGLVVLLVLIPIAAAIGLVAVDDRAAASTIANEVARSLKGLATKPGGSALGMLEQLIVAPYEASGFLELVSRGNSFSGVGQESLRAGAFLQVTMCEDVPLEIAVRLHSELGPFVCTAPGLAPVQTLMERFIDRYWTRSFGRSRFLFRNPTEVAMSIERLASCSVDVRARRILEIVADGLGTTLPPAARNWCRGRRQTSPSAGQGNA